jgi:hypothetical protein
MNEGCTKIRVVAMTFPELLYSKHTCIYVELTASGHLRSTPPSPERLYTLPNDVVTVGNIFGTPVVE